MSETTEVSPRRPSRKLVITVGVVAAVALITVVSVLTGGKATNTPTNQLVGQHMKSFSVAGLNGGTVTAPWVLGHPSVVMFFASWCGPCKAEMPKVAAYLRTHNLSPVAVLGVDVNDPLSAGRAFVKKDGFTFPVASDMNFTVTNGIFGFGGIPETVFLNAKGVVLQVYFGAIPTKQLASDIKLFKSA